MVDRQTQEGRHSLFRFDPGKAAEGAFPSRDFAAAQDRAMALQRQEAGNSRNFVLAHPFVIGPELRRLR